MRLVETDKGIVLQHDNGDVIGIIGDHPDDVYELEKACKVFMHG